MKSKTLQNALDGLDQVVSNGMLPITECDGTRCCSIVSARDQRSPNSTLAVSVLLLLLREKYVQDYFTL